MTGPETGSVRGVRIVLVVVLPFGCGYYLSYLFRTLNAVISEDLTTELGIGPADLGLLTSIYLIAFASSQLPLGVALDRFGPRRVNAGLLLFAAAGSAVFAFAEEYSLLLLGRALIGFGVSSALMGAFKANTLWFPVDRIPLMNNLIGTFGALGAVSATRPVELMLHIVGWRDIFAVLAVVTVLVSLLVFVVVPEPPKQPEPVQRFRDQIAEYRQVLLAPFFWRLCFLYSCSYTAFLSYQSLWADPWLRDVAGLDQSGRAGILSVLQIGFLIGLPLTGVIADRLRRTRVRAVDVFVWGVALFIAVQVPLALGMTRDTEIVWGLFGLLSSATYLAYAVLVPRFPAEISGRAMTTLNFCMFIIAFAGQWGMGGLIELFAARPDGTYPTEAHLTTFWVVIAFQLVSLVNFLRPARTTHDDE